MAAAAPALCRVAREEALVSTWCPGVTRREGVGHRSARRGGLGAAVATGSGDCACAAEENTFRSLDRAEGRLTRAVSDSEKRSLKSEKCSATLLRRNTPRSRCQTHSQSSSYVFEACVALTSVAPLVIRSGIWLHWLLSAARRARHRLQSCQT